MSLPGIHLIKGYQLIFSKGFKRYSLIPVLINLLCFIGLYTLALNQFWHLLDRSWELPAWLSWFETIWQWVQPVILWLLYILSAIVLLFITGFIASVITSILASPIHSFMCEKILHQHGRLSTIESSLWKIATESLKRETSKILYMSWRTLLLVIMCAPFLWVPVLNVVASAVLFTLGGWMLAMEYIDFAFEANNKPFKSCKQWLRSHKVYGLGFGLSCMTVASIPILNLFSVTAGVAGATLLYLETSD